ncbi:hypothetical protein FRC12_010239, partial [Ceratobasidium sp. 428]
CGVPFYLIARYVQDPLAVPRPVRWMGERIEGLLGRKGGGGAGYMRAATEGEERLEMIQRS